MFLKKFIFEFWIYALYWFSFFYRDSRSVSVQTIALIRRDYNIICANYEYVYIIKKKIKKNIHI